MPAMAALGGSVTRWLLIFSLMELYSAGWVVFRSASIVLATDAACKVLADAAAMTAVPSPSTATSKPSVRLVLIQALQASATCVPVLPLVLPMVSVALPTAMTKVTALARSASPSWIVTDGVGDAAP